MQFDDLIKNEIRKEVARALSGTDDFLEKIERIYAFLDLISNLLVIRQDSVCRIADISAETLRKNEREGNIQSLSSPGSRQVFYTVKSVLELEPKIRGKKRPLKKKRI